MTRDTANFEIADTARMRLGDTLRGCFKCAGTGKIGSDYCRCGLGQVASSCDQADAARRRESK